MASTTTKKKKNNTGAAHKKAAASANTRKKTTKQNTRQNARDKYLEQTAKKQDRNSNVSLQAKSVILFASSLLLFFVTIIPGESIWASFRSFLFGLFGICTFIWPVFLIITAVMIALEKPISVIRKNAFKVSVLIIMICTAIHIFAHNKAVDGWLQDVIDAYLIGINQLNGGAVGAAIGGLFLFLGKTPAVITIVIVLVTTVMMFTHVTLQTIIKKVPYKKEIINKDNTVSQTEEESPKFSAPPFEPQTKTRGRRRFNPDIPVDIPAFEQEQDDDEDLPDVTFEPVNEPVPDNVRLDDIIQKATYRKSESQKPADNKTVEKPRVSPNSNYQYPPLECLEEPPSVNAANYSDEMKMSAQKLVDTLKSFGVETKIVDISRGPSVTRYELQPAAGVRINRISNLADDIALNLASSGVRIEAPIPNKSAVGIEVPNRSRTMVTLREIVDTPQFRSAKSKLNVALGKDITGNIACADLAKMPHLLIAGTTGSGKSVCLNSMIVSILYNASPDEVKLLMIDPKKVEFSIYNGIPHLLVPVVSDPRKASGALGWAVTEMLNRYKLFSENNVRDMKGYNALCRKSEDKTPLPHIVIFIDELSDLMMAAPNEVEDSICRLAQMARAAGMHLVIATQRPSVDVITGLIKANIPSRLALSVSSSIDSRTILDVAGAEKLLGNGDMLFNPVGIAKPVRIQGCFLSDEEVESVVSFIKNQEKADYDEEVLKEIDRQAAVEKKKGSSANMADGGEEADEMLPKAIEVVVEAQAASTTLLQRRLRLGYARAARLVDELESRGIVGPYEGSKPRKVLITKQQWLEMNALSGDVPESSDEE